MANHKSAAKRIVQTKKRNARNTDRISRIRTIIKKFMTAVKDGTHDEVRVAFAAAQSEIQRGVSKGVFHRNTADRKVSRLYKRMRIRFE